MNTPDSNLIEPRFKKSLDRYVEHGIPPGGFLNAVLENNLTESFARADQFAIENLRHIVAYIYWEIPGDCHGSPKIVSEWIRAKRAPALPASGNGITEPRVFGGEA